MAFKRTALSLAALVSACLPVGDAAFAQTGTAAGAPAGIPPGQWPAELPFTARYADVVDLADSAPLVVRVAPKTIAPVSDSRTRGPMPGSIPGTGRFYIEAQTLSLIAGHADLAPKLSFLADLPVDAKGKPPVLKKSEVIVFARPVAGNSGELALVSPDALLLATPETIERTRAVLTALVQPDAPKHITGVREIVHAAGDLAGESETQVFLKTDDGSAASLTIAHKPGAPARWGASFSELTANIDAPPQRDTLVWYRLACFLPRDLSADADPSDSPEDRAAAMSDYRFVLRSLGECTRLRRTAN